MRTITSNLEKMKLHTKHSGTTGESTHGSDETARRPPPVKAALSVLRLYSTRDSSPVRRALPLPPPPPRDRENGGDDSKRSPTRHRSVSHDREYDRPRSRSRDRDRRVREGSRDRYNRERDRRHDYDGHYIETNRRGDGERRHEGSRYYRESGGYRRSRSMHCDGYSPRRLEKEKTPYAASTSSNLAKLKDLYGDLTNHKDDGGKEGVVLSSMFLLSNIILSTVWNTYNTTTFFFSFFQLW